MKIWVDADACPRVIKEILYRAAERMKVKLTLVANKSLRTPDSPYLTSLWVPAGADVADQKIVELMEPGDLVVTADIPLAARVVEEGGIALDPRGELYTDHNIGERLATRDLLSDLRGSGLVTGGPAPISNSDRRAFASHLDRILTSKDRG